MVRDQGQSVLRTIRLRRRAQRRRPSSSGSASALSRRRSFETVARTSTKSRLTGNHHACVRSRPDRPSLLRRMRVTAGRFVRAYPELRHRNHAFDHRRYGRDAPDHPPRQTGNDEDPVAGPEIIGSFSPSGPIDCLRGLEDRETGMNETVSPFRTSRMTRFSDLSN